MLIDCNIFIQNEKFDTDIQTYRSSKYKIARMNETDVYYTISLVSAENFRWFFALL